MQYLANVVVADFDGDGKLDIVGGGTRKAETGQVLSESSVIFFQNIGTVSSPLFSQITIDPGNNFDTESLAFADLSGGCHRDVVAAGFNSGKLGIFLNTSILPCRCRKTATAWSTLSVCLWPFPTTDNSLTLGSKVYTQTELLAILLLGSGSSVAPSLKLAKEL